jgi:hypothetical protein
METQCVWSTYNAHGTGEGDTYTGDTKDARKRTTPAWTTFLSVL